MPAPVIVKHKEILIKTSNLEKIKEIQRNIYGEIDFLNFRLEDKQIYDNTGIQLPAAIELFNGYKVKKFRLHLKSNPITHITIEEISKCIPRYLTSITDLVVNFDGTMINDNAIKFIVDMVNSMVFQLKSFSISLSNSPVT